MHPNDFAMARIQQAEALKEVAPEQDAAFASDLGLKPGQWPAILDGYPGGPLWKGLPSFSGGELASVEYYRPGFRLTVFND